MLVEVLLPVRFGERALLASDLVRVEVFDFPLVLGRDCEPFAPDVLVVVVLARRVPPPFLVLVWAILGFLSCGKVLVPERVPGSPIV